MSGAKHRRKGSRVELEVVHRHTDIGVHSEKVPLSGAAGGRFKADVDVYAFGGDQAPLCCEVKSRRDGAGFKVIESWLKDNDALFLRRDRSDLLVVLPWRVWARLIGRKS